MTRATYWRSLSQTRSKLQGVNVDLIFLKLFLRISFRHDKGFLCVHRDIIPKES